MGTPIQPLLGLCGRSPVSGGRPLAPPERSAPQLRLTSRANNVQRYRTPRASFRSGLEEVNAEVIRKAGLPVWFERFKIPFLQPAKARTYLADFILPNGIVIETKGLFQTEDRQKHQIIKKLYPCLDLRFVFQRAASPIAKKSPTSYAKWCDTLGFKWANKTIPLEWMKEPPNRASLATLKDLGWTPA